MSEQTDLLKLPYIMPAQAQKHVTHNEALSILDAVLHIRVNGVGTNTPPGAPVEGERHVVGSAPTGVFASQANRIAAFQDGVWAFFTPQPGWTLWDATGEAIYVFHDGSWIKAAPPPERLTLLGIETDADTVNRLAIAAAASLFTHAGAGHQIKVNKAAAANTASLLFQTNWSGRAEMGLAGNDDFSVKVSADGSTWKTPLYLKGADGFVGVNATDIRYLLTAGQPGATDSLLNYDKTIGVSAAGAAYFRGQDTTNNVRFVMGTFTNNVMLASKSNHPLVFKVNDTVEALRMATTGQIGIGITAPNASALVDMTSTTRGFLPPRMTTTHRNAIASPAEGLVVYNMTLHQLLFWNGTAWMGIAGA